MLASCQKLSRSPLLCCRREFLLWAEHEDAGKNGRPGWDGGCEIPVVPAFCPGGFSLIELLVTLVLMIILSNNALGLRVGQPPARAKKSLRGKSLENLPGDGNLCQRLRRKIPGNNQRADGRGGAGCAGAALLADTGIFICPGSRDSSLPAGESFRRRRISYAYYMGWQLTNATGTLMSDRQVDTLPKNEGDFVFSTTGKPPGNNHHKYGGNFLFCDGRIGQPRRNFRFPLWLRQASCS